VFSKDDRLDIAPNGEIGDHPHPTRVEQRYQVVEDGVRGCFMADLPVAVFIDVEFEALELHDLLIWYIIDRNRGKIRETGPGTEAGEFGDLQVYDVIPLRVGVGPDFELTLLDFVSPISAWDAVLLFVHRVFSPIALQNF